MQTPRFTRPGEKTLLRTALTLTVLLLGLAILQFRAQIVAEELILTSLNFRAALGAGYVLLGLLGLLAALAWTGGWAQIAQRLAQLGALAARVGGLGLPLFVVLLGAYLVLVLGFYGRFLLNPFPRLALFWFSALLGASLLGAWRGRGWLESLPASVLALALTYSAATFFQQVSTYPLSLDWSEISRYYQASFYFSEKVYGVDLAWPVTHPSRYLLQSIPFALGQLPLWAHRLWQALLWVGMPLFTAWVLARRLGLRGGRVLVLFALWAFLYLMQGAVFYHLLPCVFLVLWGFDRERLGRSLVFVIAASIWAGISRINWAPLPGALAALLYLLETPLAEGKKAFTLRYWGPPAIAFLVGSLSALGAYWLYILSSGVEDISQFGSSFTSALLWDRLWPNAAFPTGILPGILLVSTPLFIVLWLRLRETRLHGSRLAAMGLILLVFFGGGLVVSVKIGGGTNLHNMDAYMVLLLVAATHFAFGRFAAEGQTQEPRQLNLSPVVLSLLLLFPVLFAVLSSGPLPVPDRQLAKRAIAQIQDEVDQALEDGMQVLFISQRHLITFRIVDAPLVHDYEKLFLMEMAISHNDPYLVRFNEDIEQWRFGLIVSDPLFRNIKDESQDSLAAENNEWVRAVARTILCAYRPTNTYNELSLQMLEPRYGSKCSD